MKKNNISCWIIIDKNNRLLLIKRKYNKKAFPNYWSLPWWNQEKWESVENTAIREIKEEVWLDFKITKLFIEDELIVEEKWIINHFYRYLWKVSWNIIIQEDECDWFWWFTFEETKKLLINSNINNIIEKLCNENIIK